MEREDLLWLAGLLEGEGCFDLYDYRTSTSRKPYARIRLAMTDQDVVERVAALWGKNAPSYPPRGSQKRSVFTTQLSGKAAKELLADLHPLMGKRRREKIEAILAAC